MRSRVFNQQSIIINCIPATTRLRRLNPYSSSVRFSIRDTIQVARETKNTIMASMISPRRSGIPELFTPGLIPRPKLMTGCAQNVERPHELFLDQHIVRVVGRDGEDGNIVP